MRRTSVRGVAICGALCASLLSTGCLGPGNATGRLYKWNTSFESKWSRQGVFLGCLPAYIVTSLGDQLIFNSWQWWTGKNPVDPPKGNEPTEFGL